VFSALFYVTCSFVLLKNTILPVAFPEHVTSVSVEGSGFWQFRWKKHDFTCCLSWARHFCFCRGKRLLAISLIGHIKLSVVFDSRHIIQVNFHGTSLTDVFLLHVTAMLNGYSNTSPNVKGYYCTSLVIMFCSTSLSASTKYVFAPLRLYRQQRQNKSLFCIYALPKANLIPQE